MNITDDKQPVFYQPGKVGIIDVAVMREGGAELVGLYSGETLAEIRERYPVAELGELGPVCAASEDAFKATPVRISEERFCEMLEVLPPHDWQRDDSNDTESFKLSERTSGNITAIFARIGADYFELSDSIFTKHPAIVAACKVAA